jgi:ribosomal protein S18 acetylase RimI-like enzyme
MSVLRAMTEPEFADWMLSTIPSYAREKVASGAWSAAEAPERARQEFATLLPLGLATPDNALFTVRSETGESVGVLWFAVKERAQDRIAYLYNIEIHPEHQRRGHALRALQALEHEVRRRGLQGVALHVFGHNQGAQALYAKLGYGVTNLNMYKGVGAAA